jgi:NADPH:quinone reductase-like Zn-dependent oxidoreductase
MRWRREASAGERILLNGAGGGVGTFALQIARSLGAEVTAVDVAAKLDRLRSLGADHVIDHTTWSPDRVEDGYDRIIDVVARRFVLAWRRALRPGGAYLVVGGSAPRILGVAILGTLASVRSTTLRLLIARLGDRDDITTVLGMVKAGTLRPVIDHVVDLDGVPGAFRQLMSGAVFGKVVVSM